MTTTRLDHYQLSQRVTLRAGVRFRASDGPFFRLSDGTTVSLAAKGPFLFRAYWKQDGYEWIEALDRDRCFVPLHIAGTRRQIAPQIVPRPYRIRSTIRPKKQRR